MKRVAVGFEQIGEPIQRGGARPRPGRATRPRSRARRAAMMASTVAGRRLDDAGRRVRRSIGLTTGRGCRRERSPSTIGARAAPLRHAARCSRAAPQLGARGRIRCRASCGAPAVEVRRQRDAGVAASAAAFEQLGRADGAAARPAHPGRRRRRRTTSWRRSPAAGAPDRRAGRDGRRPARRCGTAHRSVLAARLVERLAHAVQALELEALGLAGHLDDGRDGQRVVRGKLRIERGRAASRRLRGGEVGLVGGGLAREHRIVGEPALLRALHLGVPVGALDEPHHEPAAERRGEIVDPRDRRRARASGRPGWRGRSRPSRRATDRRRRRRSRPAKLQPVGLLGIDGEVEVVALGGTRQSQQARHELAHDALRACTAS